jgi:hypothetical protein
MEKKPGNPDHELEDLGDFGKVKFDPDKIAATPEELEQLDAERFYQGREDKPSDKRAPGGAGNPEAPEPA